MKKAGVHIFLLLIALNCGAQGSRIVHKSNHVLAVNGSWDQTKNTERAQFVTGNENIQSFFLNNYKITVARLERFHKGIVEIKCLIKPDGKLDSIEFIQRDDQMNNLEAINLLMLTDGAWRAGMRDGSRMAEWLIIRFFFFDGAKEKSVDKLKEKATESFTREKIQDCLDYCSKALDLNPFETDLLILKGQCLLREGNTEAACDAFRLAKHYYSIRAEEWIINNCSDQN